MYQPSGNALPKEASMMAQNATHRTLATIHKRNVMVVLLKHRQGCGLSASAAR
jgi:hypothetical protein